MLDRLVSMHQALLIQVAKNNYMYVTAYIDRVLLGIKNNLIVDQVLRANLLSVYLVAKEKSYEKIMNEVLRVPGMKGVIDEALAKEVKATAAPVKPKADDGYDRKPWGPSKL